MFIKRATHGALEIAKLRGFAVPNERAYAGAANDRSDGDRPGEELQAW
jgi:hypothetical protein